MTKRVQIGADGQTVDNVSLLGANSPPGSGTFLDVADTMPVSPRSTWNKSVSSPVFTIAPGMPFADPSKAQVGRGSTINGQATLAWPVAFADIPNPFGSDVIDANGGVYIVTILSVSTNNVVVQVKQERPLPPTILTLAALAGFDTFQLAPDGTVVTCAGRQAP